jgi:hypothetical protein
MFCAINEYLRCTHLSKHVTCCIQSRDMLLQLLHNFLKTRARDEQYEFVSRSVATCDV